MKKNIKFTEIISTPEKLKMSGLMNLKLVTITDHCR